MFGPSTQIECSVEIGIHRVFALFATKLALTFAIGLLTMTTSTTGTRTILGIEKDNPNSSFTSLILYERSQLKESPVAQRPAEALRNRVFKPDVNTLKVFHCNPGRLCLSLFHQSFRNVVIDPTLIAGLSTTHAFELSLSVLCPLSLVLFSCGGFSSTISGNFFTRELFSSRVSCKIYDTQVNPQPLLRLDGWGFGIINTDI